jgi:DNA-binding transcriptional regulator YhcF (GntR family)
MMWTVDPANATPLRDQISACVWRGLANGELAVGSHLPPAAELADSLSVDRNTVLAAYRHLRDRGVLEFRRGRGVRVAATAGRDPMVVEAAVALIELARTKGIERFELVQLIEELS